jgi:hypothetical protein
MGGDSEGGKALAAAAAIREGLGRHLHADEGAAARAYLVLIGRNPAAVSEALHPVL